MAKNIEIDFSGLGEKLKAFFAKVEAYFTSLDTYEIVAWSGIGVGLALLIVGLAL